MGFDDCYQLGNVVESHGLRGELVFYLDVDDPSGYMELESVFIDIKGKLVPFFIESFRLQGNRAIVSLEDIENLESASQLISKNIYLPLNKLPKLTDGKYYYHELIGFVVYNGDNLLGTVKEVFQIPANHLLGVDYNGKEILIPIEDQIVLKVDTTFQKILTDLPDGLLDVYLDQ